MIGYRTSMKLVFFTFVMMSIFLSGCSYYNTSRFDWDDDWTEHKIEIYDIAKNNGISNPFLVSRIDKNDYERFNLFYTDIDNSYLGLNFNVVAEIQYTETLYAAPVDNYYIVN